jgi:hypothetical protein
MRLLCAGVAAAFLACGTMAFADTVGDCDHPIETPLRERAALVIESRPGGVEIVGTDAEVVRVSCTVENAAMDVELRLSGTPGYGRLNITSPIRNQNLKIRIEVPRKTNLRFHMGAGEVDIKDVAGDKDIDLYAGQITIEAASAGSYKSVEASVDIGDVNASAYGVDKGGFFRTFRKTIADGEYRLRAHVMTGQIDLQ